MWDSHYLTQSTCKKCLKLNYISGAPVQHNSHTLDAWFWIPCSVLSWFTMSLFPLTHSLLGCHPGLHDPLPAGLFHRHCDRCHGLHPLLLLWRVWQDFCSRHPLLHLLWAPHLFTFTGLSQTLKTLITSVLISCAGFFVLLAMAVYTGVTVNYYGKRYGSWRFSWSYIMGWVAVVLTFFSGMHLVMSIKRCTLFSCSWSY